MFRDGSKPQSDLPMAAKTQFDAAVVAKDAADMLVKALFQHRLPGRELEAQSVLKHGEAPASEIGDTRQPAGDLLAAPRRAVSQSTLCAISLPTRSIFWRSSAATVRRGIEMRPSFTLAWPILTRRASRRSSAAFTSWPKPVPARGRWSFASSSR